MNKPSTDKTKPNKKRGLDQDHSPGKEKDPAKKREVRGKKETLFTADKPLVQNLTDWKKSETKKAEIKAAKAAEKAAAS